MEGFQGECLAVGGHLGQVLQEALVPSDLLVVTVGRGV